MLKSPSWATTTRTPARGRAGLAALALLLHCWLPAQAAEEESESSEQTRPRIGLVLGGGGARGAAHIGVLKVLEELRIPVDYVAGTSMGSIVGGLYATGMNPEEIEAEILAMDWDDVFHDYPAREDRSFRRKRDDDLYAFKAKPGFNDGKIELPLAYIRGQKLDLVLNRLTLPMVDVTDFDNLPIPYRAVATDIETGKEVVLGGGSLAMSIRASMAVPAAFDPVVIDDRLLVDGGLANNVPVSVARDMGADVFIVVDVGTGLATRDKMTNALAITGQLASFLFTLNTEHQLNTLTEDDVLIIPELGDIGGGSFDRAGEAILPGELAAQQVIDKLRRYSVSEQEFAQHIARRAMRNPGMPVIDYVRVENDSGVGDAVIASRITAEPGQPLDLATLEHDINQIYGLEIFSTIGYDIEQKDEQKGLVVDATAKDWGPGFLQAGLTSSNNFQGDSTLRFGLLYTRTQINKLNGEWRLGAQVGDESGITAEIYQPLDPKLRYFVTGRVGHINQVFNVYDDQSDNLARYQLGLSGLELAGGREFGAWGEGRVGYRRYSGTAELRIGEPAPDIDADRGEAYIRLSADEMDDLYFPNSGYLGATEYIWSRESLGASSDYDQVLFGYNHAFTWGHNTLVGSILGGTTIDDNAPLEGLFRIGGLFRLSGLQENQLSGQHAGMMSLMYMRRLKRSALLKAYLGFTIETGNAWQDSDDISFDNSILAGSTFLGLETPIGPVYIGYGLTDTDESSVYLHIGPKITF